VLVENLAVAIELNVTGGDPGVAKDAYGREVKNWKFPAGDNPTIVVTVTDASDSSAVDLTSASAKLTVADVSMVDNVRTVTEKFELTGAIQTPATGGIIHFQPTTTQANGLGIGCFRYDVQIVFSDGTRRTVAVGDWETDGDISDTGEN